MKLSFSLAKRLTAATLGALLAVTAVQAQEVVPEARALLPAEMTDKGILSVGGAMVWPPYQWVDEKDQIVGFEPDLMRLLGAKLGLNVTFDNIKFSTVIPSIETRRYDVSTGQLGLTVPRLEVVSFVPNSYSRLGLLTAKGKSDLDVNNLCGHTLAVTIGSVQVAVVDKLNKACVAGGKPAITINEYPDTPSSYLAVGSGRADGFVLTRAVAVHMSGQNPNMDISSSTVDGFESVSGLMLAKDRPELRAALVAAMESAIRDGSYQALLDKYNIGDIAIEAELLQKPLAEIAQP